MKTIFFALLSSVPWLRDHPSLLTSPFGPKVLENFIIDPPKSRCGPITSGSCLELPILVILNEKYFY